MSSSHKTTHSKQSTSKVKPLPAINEEERPLSKRNHSPLQPQTTKCSKETLAETYSKNSNSKPKPAKTSPHKCEHLEKIKLTGGLKTYAKICVHQVNCTIKGTKNLKKGEKGVSNCMECNRMDGLISSCLDCEYSACIKRGHLEKHVMDTGHYLSCDLRTANIYCFECGDIIYDKEFEDIFTRSHRQAGWMSLLPVETGFHGVAPKIEGLNWGLTKRPMVNAPNSTIGLRGLLNLGHTCFMNCIVQAMIHTPILRDFFLLKRILCADAHDEDKKKPCIVTIVCDLYQAFYSGGKDPLSLHELLLKIWGNAAHLAGYEQQDAHEFFIAMLDALHLHFNIGGAFVECTCVIDRIFLGQLQSKVVCTECGHESITIDPFWDISLDLSAKDPQEVLTLKNCLNRYTRIEDLGETGMIFCNVCCKNQQSTKQLQFKSLPFVLTLHLKRFEHFPIYKKINNIVSFPEYFDLSEYTSDYDDCTPRMAEEILFQQSLYNNGSRYCLYAVVNHLGSLQGGHYYAFVRHSRNEWYKCNDHCLTTASLEDVLSSPGYLLFYHKDIIQYQVERPKFTIKPKPRTTFKNSI